MTKYLMLKHYRGAPAAVNDAPLDRWDPEDFRVHVQYMEDFADRLKASGEYVDSQGSCTPRRPVTRSELVGDRSLGLNRLAPSASALHVLRCST